jgi:hypothetical protein
MACGAISDLKAAQRPRKPRSISRLPRFGPDEAEKRGKRKESFAKRNKRFRDTGRKSLRSLSTKWRHFAEVFVFNDLNAFSLRPAEARNLHPEEGRERPSVKQ